MSFVGEAATRLPAGAAHPGVNGGLTFALSTLVGPAGAALRGADPRRAGARTRRRGGEARRQRAAARRRPGGSTPWPTASSELHEKFEEHLTIAVDTVAQVRSARPPRTGPAATRRAMIPMSRAPRTITLRFDAARCIHSRHCVLGAPSVFLANVKGPWLHPETVTVEQCVAIAHACPSGAITYERHDGGAAGSAAGGERPAHPRERALCRARRDRSRRPRHDVPRHALPLRKVREQALLRQQPSRRPASPPPANRRRSSPIRSKNRGGALAITPLTDGPLQVLGNLEICSGTGRTRIARGECAPVPLRRLGQQAVLRRHACPHRLPLGANRRKRGPRRDPARESHA